MWLVIYVLVAPYKAFDRLKCTDFLWTGIFLMILRWGVTALNTVYRMYVHGSPALFDPPFGMELQAYRYYEIFWYAPYGVMMLLVIAWIIFHLARAMTQAAELTFRKTLELVALTFFAPWLVSAVGDPILVYTVNARPEFLVPLHIALLTWECFLLSLGFHRMFDLPFWRKCTLLGFAAGVLFVALGALVIR